MSVDGARPWGLWPASSSSRDTPSLARNPAFRATRSSIAASPLTARTSNAYHLADVCLLCVSIASGDRHERGVTGLVSRTGLIVATSAIVPPSFRPLAPFTSRATPLGSVYAGGTSMSQISVTSEPAVVRRSQYVHVRSLLTVACIAIIALSIAVALLATTSSGTSVRGARAIMRSSAATADTGARLDHRGLHDAAYLSALSETGARLDHRGLRASSTH